ncbi:uncharacterized protein F5Z01DRAFT_670917 [Emericellopsis atlantica]|uniref:Uncharacterized protein n=1 Tax=Emericellopsis atlantica TaxID=2614577 RepID=A0A9P8CSM9_9HYPO|nr:uncharacterized protein F5Z01DRAFT_670917 [Emericellopsis atlantica]KAG9258269.1 hypothetical protein F5Z01DRAFT_670917 [Emericellopsis atlantica]
MASRAANCARLPVRPPAGHHRLYSSKVEESIKRVAREAATKVQNTAIPRKVLIYHAGTIRTTFLGFLKASTLLVGAFYLSLVVPAYIKEGKDPLEIVKVAACGIIPAVFIGFISTPFVTHIHIRLPQSVAGSRQYIERYLQTGGLKPTTPIEVTTVGVIATPRTFIIPAGDLLPTRRRMGIVNYVRRSSPELEQEIKQKKWYQFRPATHFYIQQGRPGQPRQTRYHDPKSDKVQWWIWETLKEKLDKRASV